ncbi:hypothetical protein J2S10_005520 [Neobacillus ginsengisoli]|uniref:Uncharacterized protein n=1 Tax=Neobacillus ginsengisoli TaxID=904295 RepID=A0ABT9Y379_9BACI|nr:hypothetical protein [Neobacillus ginsengisoli]
MTKPFSSTLFKGDCSWKGAVQSLFPLRGSSLLYKIFSNTNLHICDVHLVGL